METGSLEQDARRHRWKTGHGRVACRGFCCHPTPRLGVPGGSHAGMAETVSAFKKPRISAVVGRFDRAQRTEHRIPPGKAATMTVPPMTRRTATDGGDEQMFGAE